MDVHESGDWCCAMYFDDKCTQIVTVQGVPLAISESWTISDTAIPYRAYVCWETKDVQASDGLKCKNGDTPPYITH